ncbi:MAG: type II toxin-antitoxin system RelE/ParE family toxin [Acetobacteraceae bacterium]
MASSSRRRPRPIPFQLYEYIARHGGADRARRYVEWIVTTWRSLANFPERGTRRGDIRPALRITSHGRRVTIAFHVAGKTVTIDRILYAGRTVGPPGEGT